MNKKQIPRLIINFTRTVNINFTQIGHLDYTPDKQKTDSYLKTIKKEHSFFQSEGKKECSMPGMTSILVTEDLKEAGGKVRPAALNGSAIQSGL